jgi:hypothetical protein
MLEDKYVNGRGLALIAQMRFIVGGEWLIE